MTNHKTAPSCVWAITAASVAGNSHIAANRGSDDAYCFRLVDECVVAAVADGAGSKSGTSAWGSHTACEVVLEHAAALAASLNSENAAVQALEATYAAVLEAIVDEANRLGLPVAALSTTLAVAVVGPIASAFAQVGDGIVVCDNDTVPAVHIPEEKGEYANETVFVTSVDALQNLRCEYLAEGTPRFALSTDGLRYKLLNIQDGGTAYEPFFVALWDKLSESEVSEEALAAFLAGLDDQTGDDKSLVVGTRVTEERQKRPAVQMSAQPPEPAPPARIEDSTAQIADSGEQSELESGLRAPSAASENS